MNTKTLLLFLLIIFVTSELLSQEQDPNVVSNDPKVNNITLIVGGGPSILTGDFHEIPVIDRFNGTGILLDDLTRIRSSLSIGISYTFWTDDSRVVAQQVQKQRSQPHEKSQAKAWFCTLFLNPVNLTGLSSASLSNNVDLGFGGGYRWNNFMIALTVDFLGYRQLRSSYVDQINNPDANFNIPNSISGTLDANDDSLFYNRVGTSVGVKFLFSLDVAGGLKIRS